MDGGCEKMLMKCLGMVAMATRNPIWPPHATVLCGSGAFWPLYISVSPTRDNIAFLSLTQVHKITNITRNNKKVYSERVLMIKHAHEVVEGGYCGCMME